MRVYKMGPKGMNQCIEKNPSLVVDYWLNEDTPTGETIEVTVLEMSEEEYNNLPEYAGP
jgi:hypothetical protein